MRSSTVRLFALGALLAVGSVPSGLVAGDPPPRYNRRLANVALSPTAVAGRYQVSFDLEIEVFSRPSADLDLSSEVVLRTGGARGPIVARVPLALVIPAAGQLPCDIARDCDGACGTARAPHGQIQMTCRENGDFPGHCACFLICPGFCDDCAIDDVLVAEVAPLPGALPEIFTADDRSDPVAPPPTSPRVNRRVARLSAQPTAVAGEYDVRFELEVELSGEAATDLDVGSVVFLREGGPTGRVVRRFDLPLTIRRGAASLPCDISRDCDGDCGSGQAPHGVVQMRCGQSEIFGPDCICELICPGVCNDCAIDDVLVAEVAPLPGALAEAFTADDVTAPVAPPPPELPRFNRTVTILTAHASPAIPGGFDILAVAEMQLFHDNPNPLDLSTRVVFQDDAFNDVGHVDIVVSLLGPFAGGCPGAGCPVNCGTATVDGVVEPMNCSIPPGSPFGCGCTVRVPVSFSGVFGAQVVAEVRALSGSQGEIWVLDDRDFHVLPLPSAPSVPLVDRRLASLRLVPVGDGRVRVEAEVAVQVFGPVLTPLDVSTDVVILDPENRPIDSFRLEMVVLPSTDNTTCAGLGCPGPCGTGVACGETVQMVCSDNVLFGLCGCTLRCSGSCECQVDLDFKVWTLPAPGSVGEFDLGADTRDCIGDMRCPPPARPVSYFASSAHSPLGGAQLHALHDRLVLSNIGSSGDDGLEIQPSSAAALDLEWEQPDRVAVVGLVVILAAVGPVPRGGPSDAVPIVRMSQGVDRRGVVLEISPIARETGPAVLEVWTGETFIESFPLAGGAVASVVSSDGYWPLEFRTAPGMGGEVELGFGGPTELVVVGRSVRGDRIVRRALVAPVPQALVVVELRAAGLRGLVLVGETTTRFGSTSPEFERGNANAIGSTDISDGIALLGFLFLGGTAPPCLDAADANDDGVVDIADAVAIFSFLFTGGAAPPSPGPFQCGEDPTLDALGCASFTPCE